MKNDIHDLLESLNSREKQVLALRYGLNYCNPKSLEEIGRLFHVSKEWIRKIEKKALTKLREEETNKNLSHYLKQWQIQNHVNKNSDHNQQLGCANTHQRWTHITTFWEREQNTQTHHQYCSSQLYHGNFCFSHVRIIMPYMLAFSQFPGVFSCADCSC